MTPTHRAGGRLRALLLGLLPCLLLAACGGSSNDSGGNGGPGSGPGSGAGLPPAPDPCGSPAQRRFVFENVQDRYLFQDLLPAGATVDSRSTPSALLDFLTAEARARGMDRHFSYLTSVSDDQAMFDEGQFPGFGFGMRFDGQNARVSQVIADGPADRAGFARGDYILAVDGNPIGTGEAFQAASLSGSLGETRRFTNRRHRDGEHYTVDVTVELVTIDAVPRALVMGREGSPRIGYIDFRAFVATAGPRLHDAFAMFADESVTDLVVDLRYNGGGRLDIADLLGDLIAGLVANRKVFYEFRFNERYRQFDQPRLFSALPGSLHTSRVVFITTRSSASASELMINGLQPHSEVAVVGLPSYGKPVGQSGIRMSGCDVLLRPVTFESVNSLGEGGYYQGLPVNAGCSVADDLDHEIGDPREAMLAAALHWLDSGTGDCGPTASAAPPMRALRLPGEGDAPAPPGSLAQRYLGVL